MEAYEALITRRSVRQFTGRPVDEETITRIAAAGQRAATASNKQPWLFVAVTTPERCRALRDLCPQNGPCLAEAGGALVVFCESANKYWLEDGSAATQNLLNAAHALGLGAVWIAGDKKDYAEPVRKHLNVPETHRLVAIVAIGHPARTPPLTPRKPLNEILFREKAGA